LSLPTRTRNILRAFSLFFAFGTTMSGLTAFLLMVPGTVLDRAWTLNPAARTNFTSMGAYGPILMALVCASCATACVGLWRMTLWGTSVAIAILTVNLLGDSVNAFVFHDWRTLIGLPIAGAMIFYLVSVRRLLRG
jgi:hypothetical protein